MRPSDTPMTCLMCGKPLPKDCSYSRRYCDDCAKERNREKTRERMRKMQQQRYIVMSEKQSAKDRSYCRKCVYHGSEHYCGNLCDYILFTGQMRGCKAGEGCSKRILARPQEISNQEKISP